MGVTELPVTEEEWQDKVADTARHLGWMVAHFRRGQTADSWVTPVKYDGKGYVDLTMVHPYGWFLFTELKSPHGRVTPDQRRWREVFTKAVAEIGLEQVQYRLWYPKDWSEVLTMLEAPRRERARR